MARTTKEIYDGMIAVKEGTAQLSALTSNSATAIWRLILWITAYGIHAFERILDLHKQEVIDIINELKPHSLRWYVNKTRAFRKSQLLIPDSDQYSDEGLTEEQIAEMQIISRVSIAEGSGVLLIKVAKGADILQPLSKFPDDNEFAALEEYLAEVKDAGVRIILRSEPADILRLNLIIHYNPMLINSDGSSLAGGRPVDDAINNFVRNLPFNGEYRNADLVDVLQKTEGVVIPTLQNASASFNIQDFHNIDILEKPFSGYYTFDLEGSTIQYIAYESILY